LVSALLFAAAYSASAPAADVAPDSSAAASKADPSSDKPASEPAESLLGWLHRSLGTRFTLIFLALTFVLVALMVMNVLAVRRDSIAPPGLIQALELRLGDDRFSEACELVRGDRSFLGRVLAAGLPPLSTGDAKTALAKATTAMEEFGSLESIKLHSRLGYVWLIAQLAPLFGLLGTIDGLIAAFDAIVHKGATPRPIDLAGGIGTALVATAVGLWIAIVAVVFHQIVLARMDRLLAQAGILAERFAEQFAAARKAGG
jgi:biopolymer transport protein ExbB